MICRLTSDVGPDFQNAYVRLFYDALAKHGIEFVNHLRLDTSWSEAHPPTIEVIHLHWPEYLWKWNAHRVVEWLRSKNFRGAGRASMILNQHLEARGQVQGVKKLVRTLKFAKRQGIKIVWTCHNLLPHDSKSLADKLGYREVARLADLIICHSHGARDACLARYRTNARTVVMRFGNYEGAYPTPGPRSEIFQAFGLDPTKPLLTSLGNVRRYKGLEYGIEAARRCEGRFQYLVAGATSDPEYAAWLEEQAAGYSWIHYIPRELTDSEFAHLSAATDLAILPYLRITGSSALLSALTFHSGVVCSNLEFFREVLSDWPDAGRLFSPGDAENLLQTIESYLRETTPEQRRESAARLADMYSWSKVIRPVIDIYREWSLVSEAPPAVEVIANEARP